MNEEKETVELTESELLFILDVTRMAREMYRIAHGHGAYSSVHDEVERKATAALLKIDAAAVSIMGRESINRQCWECANCKEPTAGWDASKFRCAFLGKDFGTWHYDVPNECPCKGKGWTPKKKEGDSK